MGLEGMDDLTRKLERLAAAATKETLSRLGVRNMLRVEGPAKDYCPVETGNLRGKITTLAVETDDGVEIRTGTNVDYGPFVEYGTGQRGAAAGVDHPDDYIYGPKPGMAPRPFLRPAWDEHREAVLEGLVEDLEKAVEDAVK